MISEPYLSTAHRFGRIVAAIRAGNSDEVIMAMFRDLGADTLAVYRKACEGRLTDGAAFLRDEEKRMAALAARNVPLHEASLCRVAEMFGASTKRALFKAAYGHKKKAGW